MKELQDFNSFFELVQFFDTEDKCVKYLAEMRWGGTTTCPYCQHKKCYELKGAHKRYKCASCRKHFSIRVGTIFEDSKIDLRKWFFAIYLFLAHKKGVSSHQLARDLKITQKSAWFMLMRIREMGRPKEAMRLQNHVQADETQIGGLEKNKHANKKAIDAAQAAEKKTTVMGILEKKGAVVLQATKWVTKSLATELIENHVEKSALLVTDGATIYHKVGKKYDHSVVNHHIGEYKNERGHHTNGIENFWSLLQRGIFGIYHQVSPEHLQRYCDEFAYRFNSREMTDANRFKMALRQTEAPLPWKELTTKSLTLWDHGKEIDQIPEE